MSIKASIPYMKELNEEVFLLSKELITLEEANRKIILENEHLANDLIKNNQEEAYYQNKVNIMNNIITLASSDQYLLIKESKGQEYLSVLGEYNQSNTSSSYEMKINFSDKTTAKICSNSLNIESVEHKGEVKDFKNNTAYNLFFLSNLS